MSLIVAEDESVALGKDRHPPGDWDQLLSQARAASVRLEMGASFDVALKQ